MKKIDCIILVLLSALLWTNCNDPKLQVEEDSPQGPTLPKVTNLVFPDVQHDIQNVEQDFQGPIDNLAWNTFIALNWPASIRPDQRGVPDRNNYIGGFSAGGFNPTVLPAGPTVWETFKPTNDVFLTPYAVPDTSFNSPPVVPSACGSGKFLARRSKISDIVDETQQAFSDAPLIDQNGNYVWYEVLYNEEAFDYVIDNKFYNANNQKGKVIDFPAGDNETTVSGAIRVKAAWKIFDWTTEAFKKEYFYLSKGYVYDVDNNTCDTATLALVGLHLTHKTKSRPEWVWATFEHMYNCPDSIGWPALPAGWKKYSFNDPSKGGPYNVKPKKGDKTPVQVLRVTPIPGAEGLVNTREINETYQNVLRGFNDKSVWQYYMLVDAQWPSAPNDKKTFGGPTPTFLANTVIETYFQGPTQAGGPPHSCMGCHGKYASKTDFGFQLSGASSPHTDLINESGAQSRTTFFSFDQGAGPVVEEDETLGDELLGGKL